jgi:O-antigen/teichoic acid export membrane protein
MRLLTKRMLNPKSFLADIALLLAGAGAAQALVILTAPLLSRIYSPEQFAGLALLTSCVGIISRFSSFKYETAIATARNKSQMGALAAIATWVLIGMTAASLLIPMLFFPMLQSKVGFYSALTFCIALPVVVFFDGMIQIVITWSVRWREFKTVSANDITRNGTSVAVQAIAGLAKVGGSGLMFGQAVGTMVALFALTFRGSFIRLFALARKSSWHRRQVVAHRFRDFPYFQMPKAVLNSLGRNLPSILLAFYYSAAATGLFYLALRLTALPAQLISQSIGRVLMQRYANLHNIQRKSLLPLLIRSTIGFALLAVPVVVLMELKGPEIFSFFLGKEWAQAGTFAGYTCLWSAGTICSTPSQMAMTVLRKNRVLLAIEASFVLPRLLPFPIFAASGDVELAIACCCIGAALNNLVMIIMGFYHTAHSRAAKLAAHNRAVRTAPGSAPVT